MLEPAAVLRDRVDDFDKQFTTWDDKVAGLVWELRPPKILPLLEKRLLDAGIPAEQRAKIVDIRKLHDRFAGRGYLNRAGDNAV